MSADIVHLNDRRPPEVMMHKRIWNERFGEDVYVVQKSWYDDGGGFYVVRDARGINVLVKPAMGVPDEFMRHVIMAWRTGVAAGMARGRDAAGRMLSELADRMEGEIE